MDVEKPILFTKGTAALSIATAGRRHCNDLPRSGKATATFLMCATSRSVLYKPYRAAVHEDLETTTSN